MRKMTETEMKTITGGNSEQNRRYANYITWALMEFGKAIGAYKP